MTDYAFIYDPRLGDYELSPSHPFKPLRLELTRSLLHHAGLLGAQDEVAPKPLEEARLLEVHDRAYVEAVKAVSRGRHVTNALHYGLGTGDNPVFPAMHEAILGVCAATVTAVDLVAGGAVQRAANLSGGLHHAHAGRASGFCVYNDLALGIEHAVRRYGLRVAYVDVDAHHGDGVQDLFYDRADVLTVSLHQSGTTLFPGTGFVDEVGVGAGRGKSVNLPLEPYTEDISFLEVFELVVPTVLRRFEPDLIVVQAGADMHYHDPLANLHLSVGGMAQSYMRLSELADELCEGRLVVTGGGGYDPYRTVPRAWSLLWGAVTRQPLPSALPEAWRSEWQAQSPVRLPQELQDDEDKWEPAPRQEDTAARNRATAERLLTLLVPS